MEPINAALLAFAEQFGTRNQEFQLSEVITPTRDCMGDILGSLRLVGADNAGAVIPINTSVNVAVRVDQDTYLTGLWFIEPSMAAQDTLVCTDAFLLRNQGAGFSQVTPLRFRDNHLCGGPSSWRRTYPFEGIPWGTLLRSGDIISVTIFNPSAAVSLTGFTVGYRGFSGPPP